MYHVKQKSMSSSTLVHGSNGVARRKGMKNRGLEAMGFITLCDLFPSGLG